MMLRFSYFSPPPSFGHNNRWSKVHTKRANTRKYLTSDELQMSQVPRRVEIQTNAEISAARIERMTTGIRAGCIAAHRKLLRDRNALPNATVFFDPERKKSEL